MFDTYNPADNTYRNVPENIIYADSLAVRFLVVAPWIFQPTRRELYASAAAMYRVVIV